MVKKSVLVETSAVKQPNITLTITGNVEKFMTITPNRLVLHGNVGEPVSGSVTITPVAQYPFKVLEAKPKNGTDIQAKIEEKKDGNAISYVLTAENIKKDPGRYYDVIVLKTDSTIKPEIQIGVYGQILEAPPKK